jgi:DNA-damage-inducible protein D
MSKVTLAFPDDEGSPFDRIKQVRPDGTQFWSARTLQGLMGYVKWQNLTTAIARAMQAASNTGADVAGLFTEVSKKSGGRNAEDFELTRYAAYLVAMNGDPNKPEVAAAQSYFAVRTREAEVTQQRAQLPRSFAEALELAARQARELEASKTQVALLEPPAHSWEALAGATGDYSLRDAAQILDRDPAIATGQNRLMRTLRELNWVDSKGIPYQREVDNGRLVARVLPYEHPHTKEPKLTSQVRVTVKGLHELHRRLGGERPLRFDFNGND